MKIDNTFEPPGERKLTADKDLTDPSIPVRPRIALGDHWTFSPTLSVGSGDSDLVYELSPQFYYDYRGTQIRIGYRSLTYDIKNDDNNSDLKTDITMSGPFLGVGFTFEYSRKNTRFRRGIVTGAFLTANATCRSIPAGGKLLRTRPSSTWLVPAWVIHPRITASPRVSDIVAVDVLAGPVIRFFLVLSVTVV